MCIISVSENIISQLKNIHETLLHSQYLCIYSLYLLFLIKLINLSLIYSTQPKEKPLKVTMSNREIGSGMQEAKLLKG